MIYIHRLMGYFIDKRYGEWIWSIDKNRNVNERLEKVGPWKCPYHNSRACMEVRERLNHILGNLRFIAF